MRRIPSLLKVLWGLVACLDPAVYCDTAGMAPFSALTLLAILAKTLGKLNQDVTQWAPEQGT